jgi:pseudaminic acid biosynthesis-associated methylase
VIEVAGSTVTSATIDFWRGNFGDLYTERNALTPKRVQRQAWLWKTIIDKIEERDPEARIRSVMEVGANVGVNLWAMRDRLPDARMFAVEPNDLARGTLIDSGIVDEQDAYSGLDDAIGTVDLIFTCGVMIHIPPDDLLGFCRRIHDHAGRWIVAIEYFSKEPREVPYRGHAGKLFTRDFGSFYLDNFPDLKPVACGFAWKRMTGMDDVTWWLFERMDP